MKNYLLILISFLFIISCTNKKQEISSPDGTLTLHFALLDDGKPSYTIYQNDEQILSPSSLGYTLTDTDLTTGFSLLNTKTSSFDQTWETVWGEERLIRNNYNQLSVALQHQSGILMNIIFRVFNDGFALQYEFPEQAKDSIIILSEATTYNFVSEPQAWTIPWRTEYYEAIWHKTPISQTDTACSPITLETANGGFAFLHEAALTDYPAQNFTFNGNQIGTFLTPWQSGVSAYEATPFVSPWRFMIITHNLADMMASRIMLNLNEECKIEDTSWIKPMKFIGIWWGMHQKSMTWEAGPTHGATTTNMKRYLDFAAQNNIDGVLAEGWNLGWDDWGNWDPSKRFDFVTPYPDWDMDEISRYADSLGVQIIGHNETGGNAADYELHLDTAYQYHAAHNIHAIKTGYVYPIITTVDGQEYNRSQSGVRHYRKVIETAAKYHICIDNHEPVMPTGLQRTYPNLFTQEGVRGQEWNAWSADGGSPCEHVTVLPFTRVMAGPVDYTPGVFNFENPIIPTTRVHATLANQLALFVIMYSPLQMACDLPENYMKHPDEFQFIRDVPCDWERSILLDGVIGDFAVMARQRRGGDDWYIGAVTDENARETTIDLSFLDDNATYIATIYADGQDANWQTNPYSTNIEKSEVTCNDSLTIRMAEGGGYAISIVKNEQ